MGAGTDRVSKAKRMEDEFSISKEGVAQIFIQYHTLVELKTWDWNCVDLMLDFDKAITSKHMSGDSRVILGLMFAFGIFDARRTILVKLSGKKNSQMDDAIDEGLEVVEAVLNGYQTEHHNIKPSQATTLKQWMDELYEGSTGIFDVPTAVKQEMLKLLSENDDLLAEETLKQQEEGVPQEITDDIMGDFPYDPERYPFYDTSEMIENPNRKAEFRTALLDGYDYFRYIDTKMGIVEGDFSYISKGMKSNGKKKNKGETIDD